MPHSYTNDTRGDGMVVVKRYEGPDSAARRDTERLMLTRLRGRLPVPGLYRGSYRGPCRISCLTTTLARSQWSSSPEFRARS